MSRRERKSFSFFDWIGSPKKPNNRLNETLLPFRKAEYQRKKLMCIGLKDQCCYQKQNSQFLQFFWARALDKYVPLFGSESVIMTIWNLLVQLAILYNLFMTPIAIFFTQDVYRFETEYIWGVTTNAIFLTILYLDILVRLNTSFTRRGKIIKDRSLIFKQYGKARFWIDLLATISVTIYLASGNYQTRFVRLIFYLKIGSLIDLDKNILNSLCISKALLAVYRLLRMVTLMWFLSSWACCIFFSIDFYYYQQQGNYYENGQLWLTGSSAVNDLNILTTFQWYVWYEYALYWAFQTEATVGYGDLTARNPPQIMYNNFIILLMTLLFAFFINSVWDILNDLSDIPQRSSEWLNMQIYLQGLKVPSKLRSQISSYMQQLLKNNEIKQIEQLITSVPSNEIKQEFYLATRMQFFKANLIFQSILKQYGEQHEIWKNLVLSLQQKVFSDEQIIYSRHHFDNHLYYLKSGCVKLSIPSLQQSKIVSAKNSFGAQEFFSIQIRNHTAQTKCFSTVFLLNYEDMIKILKKYPIIHEQYFERFELVRMKKQPSYQYQCWKCQIKDHSTSNCPLLTYLKSQIIIRKQQQSTRTVNQRREYRRANRKSSKSCLKNFWEMRTVSLDKIQIWSKYHSTYNMSSF